MSDVPDNDVQRLYSEILRLSSLVQAQNARISILERQVEQFMIDTNFAVSRINNIADGVSSIGEIMPVLNDFFENYKSNLRI